MSTRPSDINSFSHRVSGQFSTGYERRAILATESVDVRLLRIIYLASLRKQRVPFP